MVGWHHQCNEHEPGQTPGDGKGQEGLAVHGVAKSQTHCTTSLSLSDAGKDRGQKEKRALEDEKDGWHHQYNEHEPGQTPGGGEGQEGLAVHGIAKSQTQLGNRTTTNTYNHHLCQETEH